MLKIHGIRNPRYADKEGKMIFCEVNVESPHLNGWVPFHAGEHDPESHGQAIYAALIKGECGEIGPYLPPVDVIDMGDALKRTILSRPDDIAALKD